MSGQCPELSGETAMPVVNWSIRFTLRGLALASARAASESRWRPWTQGSKGAEAGAWQSASSVQRSCSRKVVVCSTPMHAARHSRLFPAPWFDSAVRVRCVEPRWQSNRWSRGTRAASCRAQRRGGHM